MSQTTSVLIVSRHVSRREAAWISYSLSVLRWNLAASLAVRLKAIEIARFYVFKVCVLVLKLALILIAFSIDHVRWRIKAIVLFVLAWILLFVFRVFLDWCIFMFLDYPCSLKFVHCWINGFKHFKDLRLCWATLLQRLFHLVREHGCKQALLMLVEVLLFRVWTHRVTLSQLLKLFLSLLVDCISCRTLLLTLVFINGLQFSI